MCLHVPGGNYLPHFDAFPVHLRPQMFGDEDDLCVGNGIAMFMFLVSWLVEQLYFITLALESLQGREKLCSG